MCSDTFDPHGKFLCFGRASTTGTAAGPKAKVVAMVKEYTSHIAMEGQASIGGLVDMGIVRCASSPWILLC
jgi:hypothetical protein